MSAVSTPRPLVAVGALLVSLRRREVKSLFVIINESFSLLVCFGFCDWTLLFLRTKFGLCISLALQALGARQLSEHAVGCELMYLWTSLSRATVWPSGRLCLNVCCKAVMRNPFRIFYEWRFLRTEFEYVFFSSWHFMHERNIWNLKEKYIRPVGFHLRQTVMVGSLWLSALFAATAAHAFSLPPFPLADVVTQAFAAAAQRPAPVPSGITRRDYLVLIAGTVEAFVPTQNMNVSSPSYGKIIDPYAGEEIQHSTPCFANAAALLLKEQYYNSTYAECTLAWFESIRFRWSWHS